MNNQISLILNGQKFTGWKGVSVQRSMTKLAGAFNFSFSDGWRDNSWDIVPLLDCQIQVEEENVITGFIDRISPTISANQHTIQAEGRDITGDLVDCTVSGSKNQFNNQTLSQIAKAICDPFGISVIDNSSISEVIKQVSFQPADTAFEVLDRVCRQQGVLPLSNERGALVLTTNDRRRSGKRLVYGDNVKSATSTIDFGGRYSEYKVLGQSTGGGNGWTKSNTAISAIATDNGVNRFRPKVFIAETQATPSSAQRRVNWEANIRSAQSEKATVTIKGWRAPNKEIWAINEIIDLLIPPLKLNGEMLVTAVRFTQNSTDGSLTHLTLTRPDAFIPEPPRIAPTSSGGVGWRKK